MAEEKKEEKKAVEEKSSKQPAKEKICVGQIGDSRIWVTDVELAKNPQLQKVRNEYKKVFLGELTLKEFLQSNSRELEKIIVDK